METPIYRVQFIDNHGETAFTECSTSQRAIDQACHIQKHAFVQGIVDDVTGDLYMTADQLRNEALLRSQRGEQRGRAFLNSNSSGD
jgi:hypothetical protein